MSDWARRHFDRDLGDEDALFSLLGVAYTRSKSGYREGVAKGSGSPEAAEKERAYLAKHRPIWSWLFDNATTLLAVDPGAPRIIWAWAIMSGDLVVHAVGCKRSFTQRDGAGDPLSVDLVTDLLGDRLTRHQVCTLELPQLRPNGSGSIGLDRPREWSLDPTWLVTRMIPGVRAA